jgi:amino acid transporter
MARDGAFPASSYFAEVNKHKEIPVRMVILVGIASLSLVWF